jgi:hypothetical protein
MTVRAALGGDREASAAEGRHRAHHGGAGRLGAAARAASVARHVALAAVALTATPAGGAP